MKTNRLVRLHTYIIPRIWPDETLSRHTTGVILCFEINSKKFTHST